MKIFLPGHIDRRPKRFKQRMNYLDDIEFKIRFRLNKNSSSNIKPHRRSINISNKQVRVSFYYYFIIPYTYEKLINTFIFAEIIL
jgi:hypothetical protein